MANEPELAPDLSPELDMVTIFSSSNHDAEMEAMAIHGILDASGIPAIVVGPSTLPNLEFQVQVPKERMEEAERVVAEGKSVGAAGAAEAELASEESLGVAPSEGIQ
jgi:hypothetical protein